MDCGDLGRFANARNILSQHARFLLNKDEADEIVKGMRAGVSKWYDTVRACGVSKLTRKQSAVPLSTPDSIYDKLTVLRLSPAFGGDPSRQRKWSAFLKRARLTEVTDSLAEVVKELHEFFATGLSEVLVGMVQNGFKRVREVRCNRGVNAIFHGGA
jgi:hypothetical protein